MNNRIYKSDLELGIYDIIGRYNELKNKLNNNSAYTEAEAIQLIRDNLELKTLDRIMRQLNIIDIDLDKDIEII